MSEKDKDHKNYPDDSLGNNAASDTSEEPRIIKMWTRGSENESGSITRRNFMQGGLLAGISAAVTASATSCGGGGSDSGSDSGSGQISSTSKNCSQSYKPAHPKTVGCVAFSPDGTKVVSSSGDHTVKIWNAATGALILTYTGHSGGVASVEFSSDGSKIVSAGGDDKTVQIWDAVTGALILKYQGHPSSVYNARFSPDGTTVASGGADPAVHVWNAATGVLQFKYIGDNGITVVYDVAFSPDGTKVASVGLVTYSQNVNGIDIWSAATGVLLKRITVYNYYSFVRFSPDGTKVLAGDYTYEPLTLWDVATGTTMWLSSTSPIGRGSFSHDGTKIVCSGIAGHVINAADGSLLYNYSVGSASVNSGAYNLDGKKIVSGTSDGNVLISDSANGKTLVLCSDPSLAAVTITTACGNTTFLGNTTNCTCNTVCSCDTVCTCNTVCSCVSVSVCTCNSQTSTYYYPN